MRRKRFLAGETFLFVFPHSGGIHVVSLGNPPAATGQPLRMEAHLNQVGFTTYRVFKIRSSKTAYVSS